MDRDKRFFSWLRESSEGAAVVEFAIVLNLFLILIMGLIDFGHLFFMRQISINASREGARYGVVYTVPKHTDAEIQAYVRDRLTSSKGMKDSEIKSINVAGAAGATETPLTVTLTVTKTWWVINKFIPLLGNTFDMTVATVMRNE